MVRVLVHQRPDPEGRPDRRLSGAVECMVAIKNFGATGRGAGKFLHGRLRFGPGIEEKRRDVRPARRSRGCEVAVERLPEGSADREGTAPDGRTPSRRGSCADSLADSFAIPGAGARFQRDCGGRHGDAIGPAQILGAHRRKQGHQDEQRSVTSNTRLGAEDIPENARPGPEVRWKAVDHLRLLRVLIGIL
jgi:hypothetical protein